MTLNDKPLFLALPAYTGRVGLFKRFVNYYFVFGENEYKVLPFSIN